MVVALPLTAVALFDAGPAQMGLLTAVALFDAGPARMGLLTAAGYLPALLFTLLAGVWIDRSRRRPLLLGADLGRAVAIGLIPVTALAGCWGSRASI